MRNLVLLAAGCVATPLLAEVTFSQDAAPIIFQRCTGCHRPGEAAPFPLMSYGDVAKHGKLIASVTAARSMPPWKALPASYDYKDSRRLTDAELRTLQVWAKNGMPPGDLSKVPPLPRFTSGWQLGVPDLVLKMDQGFTVQAEGSDLYPYLRFALNLPEDKWLRAIELRPSAPKVVHHVLYYADPADDAKKIEAGQVGANLSGMKFSPLMIALGGIAVGAQPHLLPDGLALKLPKGTDLMFQYHFHPSGKEEVEQSTVGLYFSKEAPKRTLTGVQLPPAFGLFAGLNMAPGDKDFRVRDSFVLPVDVEAVSIGAHAHYIAKTMKMTATLPDGATKILLDIKDWDFAWQDRYFFESFVPLPKGTRLDSEISWDNSEDNPRNPSRPPVPVRWGEQTRDEMGSVTLQVVPAIESDLAQLRGKLGEHTNAMARAGVMKDPGLLVKIRELTGGSESNRK